MLRARIKAIQPTKIKSFDNEVHDLKKNEMKVIPFRNRNELRALLELKEKFIKEVPMDGVKPVRQLQPRKSMLTEEVVDPKPEDKLPAKSEDKLPK